MYPSRPVTPGVGLLRSRVIVIVDSSVVCWRSCGGAASGCLTSDDALGVLGLTEGLDRLGEDFVQRGDGLRGRGNGTSSRISPTVLASAMQAHEPLALDYLKDRVAGAAVLAACLAAGGGGFF